jgi:hypothetical protein
MTALPTETLHHVNEDSNPMTDGRDAEQSVIQLNVSEHFL